MTLGVTTIQRDRAPWVKEWVAFHYLVGFRKFIFYAHNCTDDTVGVLRKLKEKFDIEIFDIKTDSLAPQLDCYDEAYKKFGGQVDWMAFIDGDEFLFPAKADSMQQVLSEYSDKNLSALGVYWACFGSSGLVSEPAGLIIENYKRRAADDYENNRHIKSIVRGGLGNSFKAGNPHIFGTPGGTYDENLRLITEGWTQYKPTYSKLRINHYVTQSRRHFDAFKSRHGTPDGRPPRDEDYWAEHDRNEVKDDSMDRFVAPLKEMLGTL